MLPGGGNDLTVDGGRALRLAAAVALAVLGLITLPDLFQAPEPPPLPADVGFRPGETEATLPVEPAQPRGEPNPRRETTGQPRERQTGRSGERGDRKHREARRGRTREQASGGKGVKRERSPDRKPDDGRSKSTPGSESDSVQSTTIPVTPVPPPPAAPAPTPPPPPPKPSVPADGSEEFAPGRPG